MNMSTFDPIWDYYSATLPESFGGTGVDVLVHLADGPIRRVRPVVPGYHRAWEIPHGGAVVGWVNEAPGKPDHVKASGADTGLVVAGLRQRVPDHSVARADAAWNFSGGPDSFDAAARRVMSLLPANVRSREVLDHAPGLDSRTLYVGSRSGSEAFGRLYEWSKAHGHSGDQNRWEVEVKPGKADRKRYLATVEPVEVLGWSRWSRTVAADLCGLFAAAPPPRLERVSDDEASLDTLTAQYGRRLLWLLRRHGGDPEAAFLDLLARIPDHYDDEPEVAHAS